MIQKLKVGGKSRAYLVAFENPTKAGEIVIGYAACHPHLEPKYLKGEAMRIARERALVLAERLNHWQDRKITKSLPTDTTWPYVVLNALPSFVNRCVSYYKDKTIVPWAMTLLEQPPRMMF